MNINLHIERLVLEGVDIAPYQRHLLHASLTAELARMFGNSSLAPSFAEGFSLAHVSTGDVQLAGNNPTQLGQQIAQSVYGGISHE